MRGGYFMIYFRPAYMKAEIRFRSKVSPTRLRRAPSKDEQHLTRQNTSIVDTDDADFHYIEVSGVLGSTVCTVILKDTSCQPSMKMLLCYVLIVMGTIT